MHIFCEDSPRHAECLLSIASCLAILLVESLLHYIRHIMLEERWYLLLKSAHGQSRKGSPWPDRMLNSPGVRTGWGVVVVRSASYKSKDLRGTQGWAPLKKGRLLMVEKRHYLPGIVKFKMLLLKLTWYEYYQKERENIWEKLPFHAWLNLKTKDIQDMLPRKKCPTFKKRLIQSINPSGEMLPNIFCLLGILPSLNPNF